MVVLPRYRDEAQRMSWNPPFLSRPERPDTSDTLPQWWWLMTKKMPVEQNKKQQQLDSIRQNLGSTKLKVFPREEWVTCFFKKTIKFKGAIRVFQGLPKDLPRSGTVVLVWLMVWSIHESCAPGPGPPVTMKGQSWSKPRVGDSGDASEPGTYMLSFLLFNLSGPSSTFWQNYNISPTFGLLWD